MRSKERTTPTCRKKLPKPRVFERGEELPADLGELLLEIPVVIRGFADDLPLVHKVCARSFWST